ncbi:nuclear transport factor 2 family protein [Shewanella nanhaiensis]|nr:nuclear transport factor 2 family protein [Shewanella nanhaiensis]
MSELEAILKTLEDYASAYCAKDIEALMHVFDDSEEISVIGTGEDELCEGRDSVRQLFLRNFAEAKANRFLWGWRNIIISGDCAVVSVSLTIDVDYQGEQLLIPIRWSVVLKKTDRWRWIHRHASSASVSQEEGEAYPK